MPHAIKCKLLRSYLEGQSNKFAQGSSIYNSSIISRMVMTVFTNVSAVNIRLWVVWALKRTLHVCLASEKVTLPLAVAIGKSKGSCFEVFQNNYTTSIRRVLPFMGQSAFHCCWHEVLNGIPRVKSRIFALGLSKGGLKTPKSAQKKAKKPQTAPDVFPECQNRTYMEAHYTS